MFNVIKVTGCPNHIRGYLRRFLIEIDAGLFVGKSTVVVSDNLWDRIISSQDSDTFSAVRVCYHNKKENGFKIFSHNHPTHVIIDLDGVLLPGKILNNERKSLEN